MCFLSWRYSILGLVAAVSDSMVIYVLFGYIQSCSIVAAELTCFLPACYKKLAIETLLFVCGFFFIEGATVATKAITAVANASQKHSQATKQSHRNFP